MVNLIVGGLIYILIGFIYGIVMLYIVISEDKNDPEEQFINGEVKVLFLLTCSLGWIILIPLSIIYRIYNKIKGGNKNV